MADINLSCAVHVATKPGEDLRLAITQISGTMVCAECAPRFAAYLHGGHMSGDAWVPGGYFYDHENGD